MASTISAGTSAGTAIAIAGDTSGALALQTNNGTTAVTIDTSQNVGIGTTSPTSKLHVYGATNSQLTLQNATNSSYVGNISGSMEIQSADIIKFNTNGANERMRIDTSGNVFIATTSTPIGGNTGQLNMSNAYNSGYFAVALNSTTTSGNQDFIDFGRGGSQCGYILSASTNSTSYVTSSDYRLKEDIAPMTGALNKVSQLKPVTYKWKSDGTTSQGFIAHELQEVVPEAVAGVKDAVNEDGSIKPQGIDTSFLVATLTAAIQELNAKVEAQATTIAELQAKVG